ncbi:MAG: SDR family NAD(P)-dependent oxidoreductase [Cyanobacteria bacterium P01_C01_bin.73]
MSFFAQLTNAHALVVGASQGIGLGFVNALLQQPAIERLYATYRTPETAAGLKALAEAFPQRLQLVQMDVTQTAQIQTGVAHIQAESKTLHFVINCVGVLHQGELQPEKALRQIETEQLLHYFQVNSLPTVLLAKHLMPLLKHSDRSIFATISAKVGSIGDNHLGGWYGYRASKAAQNMFLRTAALEYGRRSPNTTLVALHPGTTDTRLSEPFQRNVPPEKLFSVERTVGQLIAVIDQLDTKDSGQFFSWDGSRLPW